MDILEFMDDNQHTYSQIQNLKGLVKYLDDFIRKPIFDDDKLVLVHKSNNLVTSNDFVLDTDISILKEICEEAIDELEDKILTEYNNKKERSNEE